jgi:precorrin-2 dehydrogenase/sirohydrochlorin ferrochelatase
LKKTDIKNNNYYPVFLDLEGKKCVIVGGGAVAERKVMTLIGTGARIRVISPDVTAKLDGLVNEGKIKHSERKYRKGDTVNAFLVIAATTDKSVNRRVFEDSPGLVNAVDMPELCNFIVPSVVSKGPLQIAISSSGLSPAVSKTLRKDLENYVPKDLSNYLSWLKDIRGKIKKKMPGTSREATEKRSKILKKIGSKEMLDMIKGGGLSKAKTYVEKMIEKDWEH